jgi:carbamoyl-phosphate synthase large subunit
MPKKVILTEMSRKMNVLITAAGRRTTLVKAFAEAVHRRKGILVAADVDGLAPALYMADIAEQIPPVNEQSYIDVIRRIVTEHHIRLIVPVIDPDLLTLVHYRQHFAELGCRLLISSPELVEIANDKWLTFQRFTQHGYLLPSSWLPYQLADSCLPEILFVKPRAGSASQHTYKVPREKLKHVIAMVPDPIIQEYITGEEITVDALLSFEGKPIHYVARKRLKVIGGESVEGVTVRSQHLHDYVCRLLNTLGEMGGVGPFTIQLFVCEGGKIILSEINPRFGGGAPLAFAAGARYPEWILDMLEGKEVEPRLGKYQTGLYMTRYYTEIFRDKPLWL